MDRNLGARQVATDFDDVFSFGNYHQWGRPADGHEITVWNGTTKTDGRGLAETTALEALAADAYPSYANFIITDVTPFDWLANPAASDVATLWDIDANRQGPCPANYHVPTNSVWNIADDYNDGSATSGGNTLGWDNNQEVYDSALKLPSSGNLNRADGLLGNQGTHGNYWSSSVRHENARYLNANSTVANTNRSNRAFGCTVRCIKD
jgi:uncharacterized protein (TIGR02145 family)